MQAAVDAGTDDERFVLLKEVGERRIAQERARGGASLPMPEQQVTARDGGGFTLEFRPPVAAEEWNAQISLLTGMAAATMMLDAGVGVLRTMPAPTPEAVAWFRRVARGLGAEWPEGVPYGEFVRGLDRANPRHLALIHEATALFRGRRLHGVRRRAARAARARGGRRPLRPRHRAAAPARRPLRPRRVRGRVPRRRGAGCRARGAARSSPA